MTIEPAQSAAEAQTLSTGEEIALDVESQRASFLNVFVDNKNGGDPAEYDLELEYYSTEVDEWFTKQELTSKNSQDPGLAADVKRSLTAQQVRCTLTANSSATYRLVVETYREL